MEETRLDSCFFSRLTPTCWFTC